MNTHPSIPDTLISRVSAFVNAHTGLHFPMPKWPDLKRNLCAASPDLGFDDVTACIQWMLSTTLDQNQMDTLTAHLTIGETYFFRDKTVFQTLKDHILASWIRTGTARERVVTIWSAACSTGEEPYSIAILLDQMMLKFRGWNFEIHGTDINAGFLEKARSGVYTEWSFRETPETIVNAYFKKIGRNRFEIVRKIKDMVRFSKLNLVDSKGFSPPAEPGGIDVIFCRNVLMYLSPDMRAKVMRRLTRSLAMGGWLILSPSEAPFTEQPGLTPVRFPGALFFRKGSPRKMDNLREEKQSDPLNSMKVPGGLKGPKTRARRALFQKQVRTNASENIRHGHHSIDSSKGTGAREKDAIIVDRRVEPERDLYQEALALFQEGDFEAVATRLNKILEREKDEDQNLLRPEHMALLARSLANMGRLDEAKTWCERAIQAEKLKSEHHYILAMICQEQGDPTAAVKSLKDTLYLDPGFVMADFMMGNLTKIQGKRSESEKHFRNVLSALAIKDPKEVLSHSDGITAERLKEIVISILKQANQ